MPYREPARTSTLPPNHDGSPGRRRLWFPPAAAGLGKVLSASPTRFPDDGVLATRATAVLGGVTAIGGLAALSTWPLAAACAAAIGGIIGPAALLVRSAPAYTTWVGQRGVAVVRRRPLEPAEPTVLLFRDVVALERLAVTQGRSQRIEDRWSCGGSRRSLVIASLVEVTRDGAGDDDDDAIEPDAARFDALPAWHAHHFARAARRAFAAWQREQSDGA